MKTKKLSAREEEYQSIEEIILERKSIAQEDLQEVYLGYLQSIIDLKVDNWSRDNHTNGLAFALGLDFSWDKLRFITKKLYRYPLYSCGGIYLHLSENPKNISSLKRVERLELDLDTLGILYEQIDIKDKVTSPNEWKIAFFEDDSAFRYFHVLREYENGTWYHKKGFNAPTNLDSNKKIITNPIESMKYDTTVSYRDLEYQRTYRLRRGK